MNKIIAIICVFGVLAGISIFYQDFLLNEIKAILHQEDEIEVDTIELKSGEKFSGKILEWGDSEIKLDALKVGQVDSRLSLRYEDIKTIVQDDEAMARLAKDPLLDAYEERAEYLVEVYQWYQDDKFSRLEDEAKYLIQQKTRMLSGSWKLDAFYYAITRYYEKRSAKSMRPHLQRIERWRQAFPESEMAIVLQLIALKEIAWYYRGRGYSSEITTGGRRDFNSYMLKAKALLDRNSDISDPRFFSIALAINKITGDFDTDRKMLLERSLVYDPEYENTFLIMAIYLLKRWGGEPGELENFAALVSDNAESDAIYMRIAHKVMRNINLTGYRNYSFDWDRIKAGYTEWLKSYPENIRLLHSQLRLACFYQDYELARQITEKTVFLWHNEAYRVWYDFSRYYSCKRRAEIPDADRQIDLHLIIRANNQPRFAEVITNGLIDIDKKNSSGETPLLYSLKYKYYDYALALIGAGANLRLANKSGEEPIHIAAKKGISSIFRLLLQQDVPVNAVTQYQWTPLFYAIHYSAYDLVNTLISQPNIDVNVRDTQNNTALHIAAKRGNSNAAHQLLSVDGIKINEVNLVGKSALNLALENNYNDIAQLLIDHGAIANANTISNKDRNLSKNLMNQGIRAHNTKNYDKARKLYNEAIQHNPNNSYAYANLAVVDIFQNKYEDCVMHTKEAIKINPRNSHAIYSSAQCLFMLHRPKQEYLPYYRQYIAIEPDNHRSKELLKKYPQLRE